MLVVSIKESEAETFGHTCRYPARRSNKTLVKRSLEAGAQALGESVGEFLGLDTNRNYCQQRERRTS